MSVWKALAGSQHGTVFSYQRAKEESRRSPLSLRTSGASLGERLFLPLARGFSLSRSGASALEDGQRGWGSPILQEGKLRLGAAPPPPAKGLESWL